MSVDGGLQKSGLCLKELNIKYVQAMLKSHLVSLFPLKNVFALIDGTQHQDMFPGKSL